MNLETLDVKIRVENKQAIKGLQDARKAAKQAEEALNGAQNGGAKNPNIAWLKKLQDSVKKTGNALRNFSQQAQLASGLKKFTPAAIDLYKKMQTTRAEAELLKAAMEGLDESTDLYKKYKRDAEGLETYMQALREERELLRKTGTLIENAVPESNARKVRAYAKEALGAVPRTISGLMGKTELSGLQAFIGAVKRAGRGIKSFATGAKNDFKSVVGWIGKMGRGFGTVLSKIPLLNRIPGILGRIKRGLFMGSGLRSLLRLGAAGFGVYQAISMAKEGFKNLAQYSGQTNKDLSMLMSSLATLKNALATAFAPILTAIAPALNYLIQLLVKAATAVAHFTAAFTGKSTVVVAKQQTVDYAASLNDAADAAGSANDAAEKYQKTLLGFDQMNVLNDTKSNSGSGGSGGGGSNVGDMFETVEVTNGAKTLAEKIKEAWAAADFTDLGMEAGTAIKNALESIPWDSIKEKAEKAGKSIATFLNGLNDSGVWSSVTKTVAEGINTIVNLFAGFVDNFSFTGAGSAFADAVNKFFGSVDWKKIGKTVSDGIKGVLDFFAELASKTNWEQIGRDLVSVITSIDWAGLIVKGIKAAGSIAVGLLNMLKGAFEEAVSAVVDWISSGDAWQDIKNIGKAALEFTVNVGGAILDTISSALSGIWDVVKAIASHFGWNDKDPSYGLHDGATTGGFPQVVQGLSLTSINAPEGVTYVNGRAYIDTTALIKSTDTSQLPTAQKTIGSMVASFKSRVTQSGFDTKIYGMTASFKNRVAQSGFDSKIYGMTASFKSRVKQSGFDSTLYSMTASISKITFASNAVKTLTMAVTGRANGGLYRNGRWQPITAAAGGGSFSSGQMFIAREAGPELVGRIGRGTAVMNNDQIVASVSAGVYEAVLAAMSGQDKSVNVYLQGDAGKLFKVVQREAVQYTNTTGLSPFPA